MNERAETEIEADSIAEPEEAVLTGAERARGAALAVPTALPPLVVRVSGRYERRAPIPLPSPAAPSAEDGFPIALPIRRETILLDVDGRYPLRTASGTVHVGLKERVHWIARLNRIGAFLWRGRIWYRDGLPAAHPYTAVEIQVIDPLFPASRRAAARFTGGGAPDRTVVYEYRSRAFRAVEFEFDCTPDATPVFSIGTHDHPIHPGSIPAEALTIQEVFRRAGYVVRTSGDTDQVPLAPLSGTDGKWSDLEMHDAMETYWSRFADRAQWAMWVFFARLHEQGTSLGGIMFDDIGPNHRQGTAIFTGSFIDEAPSGDPAPDAWRKRMKFWTACHEMGHAFNLAHSWEKSLGTGWIPLADDLEARSFMNYPRYVAGGESAFFGTFPFRFSDPELLFMRHAPERFVEMGNADWFDHHGFEQAEVRSGSGLRLEVRINQPRADLEFLEPLVA
ncbi:MAG: hypothetical protein ACREIU_15900, partial [Planctomycetota bacterium]